jgi:DNA-binding Xre family transcriptional regulator
MNGAAFDRPLFLMASIMQVYARNIQLHMARLNLTTSQLSDQLYVTPASFNRIRSGRARIIDPDILNKLRRIFSCTANDLLEVNPAVDYK